jgi:hypothetical protein
MAPTLKHRRTGRPGLVAIANTARFAADPGSTFQSPFLAALHVEVPGPNVGFRLGRTLIL